MVFEVEAAMRALDVAVSRVAADARKATGRASAANCPPARSS